MNAISNELSGLYRCFDAPTMVGSAARRSPSADFAIANVTTAPNQLCQTDFTYLKVRSFRAIRHKIMIDCPILISLVWARLANSAYRQLL